MLRISLADAQTRLPDLVEQAQRGEDVVIEGGDGASVRLVAEAPPVSPVPTMPGTVPAQPGTMPVFGRGKGQVVMRDDFDDPISGFEPYM